MIGDFLHLGQQNINIEQLASVNQIYKKMQVNRKLDHVMCPNLTV